MALCKTCGQKAGLFRSECSSCKTSRIEKEEKERETQRLLAKQIKAEQDARRNIIQGWVDLLMDYTSDHFLDKSEEQNLLDYKTKNNILDSDIEEVNKNATTFFDIYIELRDFLQNNKLPEYDKSEYAGFNFQKSEAPFFRINLPFFEERKVTIRKGRSDGYSIRVMKGVWLRQNFHNPAVQSNELVFQDVGDVVLTNKHIYFKGNNKTFRHRLDKLVEITPYRNGIQIMKDTMSAKPQFFGFDGNVASLGSSENPDHFNQMCQVFCHVAATLCGNL